MPKFTPGPWRANNAFNFSGTFDAWIGKGKQTLAHAQIHDNEGSREECEANARLIAAAPGMYHALKQCREAFRTLKVNFLVENIGNLLAKIDGESEADND